MILHGKDLIVSIDGNSMLASKSCTLKVSAKSITKTSPTSGQWEEVLTGKKSWSLSTDHLVKPATVQTVSLTGAAEKFYFQNSKANGLALRGQENDNVSSGRIIDEVAVDEGIYLMEINVVNMSLIKKTVFSKDGKYGSIKLEKYLDGTTSIGGSTISSTCMIVIMTIGEFVLNTEVCGILDFTYHIALPCVQFGNSPISGPKTYDSSPIIIVGGQNLSYGYTQLNSVSNELNITLYGGVQVPVIDGIPGNIEMVGKMANIRMTDENGSYWSGQAEITQFDVRGTKGSLMTGQFSFKGNGELQTDKKRYDVKPMMPAKLIDRVIIDMNESNPARMITGDVNGAIVNNILKNFHRYLGKYQGSGRMTICQLDDENSNFYHDGTPVTLDGTTGDVFVACEMPEYEGASSMQGFFYNVQLVGTGKYMLSVTAMPYSGFKYWSEGNLIGAFKAQPTTSYNNNTAGEAGGSYYLRSIVNEEPTFADTFEKLDTAIARMNGSYFGKVGPEEHAIVAMLYYMKYGNTNSQVMIGNGYGRNDSSESVTGATASMGMKDTDAYTGVAFVNLFGLEDWWSRAEGEYMERIRYNNGKIYITPWGGSEDAGTSISTAQANEETVIRNMLFSGSSNTPLMMIPAGDQGAQSKNWETHFCDAVRIIGQSEKVTRGKGDTTLGSGLAAMKLGRNTTSEDTDATRLCFRGNVTIQTNVSLFEGLTIADPLT